MSFGDLHCRPCGASSSAAAACLHSTDLLEHIVLPLTGGSAGGSQAQASAVGLFLISKPWREAVQSLRIWRVMEWEVVMKGELPAGHARLTRAAMRSPLPQLFPATLQPPARPLSTCRRATQR